MNDTCAADPNGETSIDPQPITPRRKPKVQLTTVKEEQEEDEEVDAPTKTNSGGLAPIIGMVIGIILFVAIALPVTMSVISSVNTTTSNGTALEPVSPGFSNATSSIISLIPLLLAIGALAFVVYNVMSG